jgi:hypothetical protein
MRTEAFANEKTQKPRHAISFDEVFLLRIGWSWDFAGIWNLQILAKSFDAADS